MKIGQRNENPYPRCFRLIMSYATGVATNTDEKVPITHTEHQREDKAADHLAAEQEDRQQHDEQWFPPY